MKNVNRKAFTLMEVMVTAVLFSLVATGVYTTFIIGTRSWSYYNQSVVLKQEVRRSIFAIAQELREGKNLFINKDPHGVTINFYRPTVGNISYSWTDEGEDANRIVRTIKGEKRILATHISQLSFEQETTDDVSIEIRAKRIEKNGQEIAFFLREKIALRLKTGVLKAEEDDS